jgi:GNAT superfamily N-acetyltransferase
MTDELLDKIRALGDTFYEQAKLPGKFRLNSFANSWHTILNLKLGALWRADQDHRLTGLLGGIFSPDLCDGVIVAQEAFWFVHPDYRGGMTGIRLFHAFEDWSKEIGASRIIMAHLTNSMPEKLKSFYQRSGFREVETTYMREL